MARDMLRRVTLRPYAIGPSFTLTIYDTCRRADYGKSVLGYRLTMRESGKTSTVFAGEDYSPGAGTCVDSDACVRGLLSFLTCRPGDTDAEYFASYTPAQLDYCDKYAEELSYAVACRFGEDT